MVEADLDIYFEADFGHASISSLSHGVNAAVFSNYHFLSGVVLVAEYFYLHFYLYAAGVILLLLFVYVVSKE